MVCPTDCRTGSVVLDAECRPCRVPAVERPAPRRAGRLLDQALLAETAGPFTGASGAHLVPVPGTVVTVPDMAGPCLVEAHVLLGIPRLDMPAGGALAATAVAPANENPITITDAADYKPSLFPVVGDPEVAGTVFQSPGTARVLVPARSPGDWQLFISGNDNIPTGAFVIPGPVPVEAVAHEHVRTVMSVWGA